MITLKEKLEKRKNKFGLIGVRLRVNKSRGNSFSADISLPDFTRITLDYGNELDLVPDESTKRFAERKKIKDPELKIGEDVLDHECGHRELPTQTRLGCPYDIFAHERIKDAVVRALKQTRKEGLEEYVTNSFEDILDNVNCRRGTDFAGQTLFWNNQGLFNSLGGKYSPFYEAFVKINLILGGNIEDTNLLRRFYTNSDEVQGSVRAFISHLKSRLGTESVIRLHQRGGFRGLFTTNLEERVNLWEDLAYNFTMATSGLLERLPKEKMFGSGKNEFDDEMKIPKTKQEIAYRRYKSKKGPAQSRDIQEQLYDLYKRISREIPINVTHFEEASSAPLIPYGARFVDEDDRTFNFAGIGVTEEGDIEVKTTESNLELPVQYKTNPVKFPKLKIVKIDRSGSMAYNPNNEQDSEGKPLNIGDTTFIPWGDRSKIHYAYKGLFGIDNFFRSQGVLQYVECSALGFSGESAIKGKSEDIAKRVLQRPSGGTSLDVNGLEREIQRDSLVVSISDGEFSLSEEDKQRLKPKLRECDYVHIQIGNDSEYSSFLRQEGCNVFTVRGDDDLSRIMVDFVSKRYS